MSSSQQRAALPYLLQQVKASIEDHLDTDPSGSVAGEEEYRDWGKEFVSKMVSASFSLLYALLLTFS